jgi:ATP-dependent phosphofructokinase / diphosphate-dependent phosphofructokinase
VTSDQDKLAIVVCGGPAPGINSVIGAATIRACLSNVEVLGIQDGFRWLMAGDTDHVMPLSIADTSRIHFRGGSHIGISRDSPRTTEDMNRMLDALTRMGIGKLITIGGDGTAFMAHSIVKAAGGRLRVVHVPKTIDNDIDLPHDASTFGFQTARHVGCEIVENLMVDAKTTSRWYFVVAQGRKAGHLGLAIGKAAGATLSLIPEEFPRASTRFATIVDTLAGAIIKRLSYGRSDGVAMLAEGLAECVDPEELGEYTDVPRDVRGNIRVAQINLCDILKIAVQRRLAEFTIKTTIMAKAIGYELRCADPIPFDMEYTRDLGYCAARHIIEGGTNAMVSMQHGRFVPIPFDEFIDERAGKTRVRMVDTSSDRYKIARTYMLRLKPEDFDDELELDRLATVAGITTTEFQRQFEHVVKSEPQNFRLTIPPERSLDPSP